MEDGGRDEVHARQRAMLRYWLTSASFIAIHACLPPRGGEARAQYVRAPSSLLDHPMMAEGEALFNDLSSN